MRRSAKAPAATEFFREARAAGQMSHRHIVTIHDLGEEGGQPFLAMEYLSGDSLATRLARGGRLSAERAVNLFVDVLGALEYAHERGIVHRDIKPANLFLTEADEVKIVDFGLAHLVSSELTRSETILGTANYMSPEQIRGERIDRRTDIFAAGAVLYELLTGCRAFDGDTFATTLYKVLETVPQPVRMFDPTIPLPLAAVVERALAKRRDDRHQTAGEMMRELMISRDALLPVHRYAPARGSVPTVVGPAATSGRPPAEAGGGLPSARPEIDRPLGSAQPQSVAWSPRRVQTTAIIGVVVAVAGAALLLTPQNEPGNGAPQDDPRRSAPSAAVVETPPPAPASPAPRPEPPAASPPAAEVSKPAPAQPQDRPAEPPPQPAARRTSRSRAESPPPARPAPAPDKAAIARADAAITRLGEARALAERAEAETLAAASYRAAVGIEGEARGLYAAGDFTRAATRAGDAESLYRSAEAQARAEAQERADARERAEAQARAEAAERERRSAQTAPVEPPAQPRPEPQQRTTPPPAPEPAVDPREAIRGIVAQYVAALRGRSLESLKAVWPSLGAAQERAIRAEFENARSVQVQLADQSIAVQGDRATVTALRSYELMTIDGHRLASQSRMTMRLVRRGETWTIESVAYQQP